MLEVVKGQGSHQEVERRQSGPTGKQRPSEPKGWEALNCTLFKVNQETQKDFTYRNDLIQSMFVFCFVFWVFFGHMARGILIPRPGIEPIRDPCIGSAES